MNGEINALKRKHAEEISTLKAEMEQQMDNKMEDMKKHVSGLENAVKVLLERASPGTNLDDLVALMRSPVDANSAPNGDKNGLPHSSTSTHNPNQE